MTPQRLRTKLRKIRELGEEMAEEGGELNLVPFLDIVTNVLIFLLATVSFAAALGDINVSSPTTSATAQMADQDQQNQNPLNLTVSISDKGFTIAASGAVLYQGFKFDPTGNLVQAPGDLLPTIPKKNGQYDYAELAADMAEIKGTPSARNETKVIINANPDITYDIVVQVLDATRGKLEQKPDPDNPGKMMAAYTGFPDVLLSAGVN